MSSPQPSAPAAPPPPAAGNQPEDDAMCRYCFDGVEAGPLISPCRSCLVLQPVLRYLPDTCTQLHWWAEVGAPDVLATLAAHGTPLPLARSHTSIRKCSVAIIAVLLLENVTFGPGAGQSAYSPRVLHSRHPPHALQRVHSRVSAPSLNFTTAFLF
jgi:hypothetical protein